jgi:hypothetical protein
VVTLARGTEPRVEPVPTGHFRWLVHEAALGDDGPGQLDDWLSDATRPIATGAAGFDACLARLEVSGSVSLAERAALDRIVESWTARLLRLDLDDQTVLAPSPDEIRELAERPGDPIIARVATELVTLLEGGAAAPGSEGPPDPDVVRRAIHMLHALVTAADGEASDDRPPTASAGAQRAAAAPAVLPAEETAP